MNSAAVGQLINPARHTDETEAVLKEEGLQDEENTAVIVAALRASLKGRPSLQKRLALVEVCFDAGELEAGGDSMKAAGYYLAAAEFALPGAKLDGASEIQEDLLEMYNFSCGLAARILFKHGHDWSKTIVVEGPDRSYRLRSRTSGKGYISPAFFDHLWVAKSLEFKGLDRLKRTVREGYGEMMVGHREWSAERLKKEPLLSPAGLALPLSVVISPVDAKGGLEMAFYDVTLADETRLAGRTVPLAADFTAPLAMFYNYKPKGNMGKQGLFHPGRYSQRMGLIQFEPYRRNEIPIVFVHGLASSPGTWMVAVNTLRADPELRKRYQLLAFYYPTGFPIAYNSSGLRQHLENFQKFYDPGNTNPAMNNMIIVGHSMGGILSNAQIRSSEDTFTKAIFTKPIDEVDGLSESQRTMAKKRLIYQADPDITRAVFVAAPHRGSSIATHPIGNIIKKLIKFPVEILTGGEVFRVEELSADLTDYGRSVVDRGSSSINSLEPDNPMLRAVLDQPVKAGVKYHSIVGRAKAGDPLEESSDTVVPYPSAHLDGAVSEKVINAKHTGLTGHAEAIEELRRILYLHAGLPYPGPVAAEPVQVEAPSKKKKSKALYYGHRNGR
ncbi:MAG: hypothetical protein QM496_14360 [Verrucomicrobiota bacterium]